MHTRGLNAYFNKTWAVGNNDAYIVAPAWRW
jgi:hypothetical protein